MKFRVLQLLKSYTYQLLLGRTVLLCLIYGGLFSSSLWVGYWLRFDFIVPSEYQAEYLRALPLVIGIKLLLLFLFGQFGVLLSYFRLPDLYRITGALSGASGILVASWYLLPAWSIPPRSILLADLIFSLFLVAGFRTGLRVYSERNGRLAGKHAGSQKRVAIIGAGRTGANLAYDLQSRSGVGLKPAIFLDDDSNKWQHQIHGVPVVGPPEDFGSLKSRFGIEGIIISMSSAPARRILKITEEAQEAGLSTDIMPSVAELATGKVRASRIRPVEIEDLLGRDPVDLDAEDIRALIRNKTVMVTGAGGSIGSELCRQIARHGPKRLMLVERCEVLLYTIETELRESQAVGAGLLPLVADVCDLDRMREIFRRYRPNLIFHAAAHKHVPMMEHQPQEALKNNTFGTRQVAMLASEFAAERFILISTDKAINPTNVMGVSKRLSEIFIQSFNDAGNGPTRFMAVRFGNVLGSSGSVVPLFRRQIADGGPVTVTHPEVIRYFMTIPEATGLVLQCATQGSGGEIFVLDMGKPIKIVDLARRMIQLSGFEPEKDIEIDFIGLRPGEKLYEELQHEGEAYSSTHHPKILRFTGQAYRVEEVEAFLSELRGTFGSATSDQIKERIQSFVPEYTPYLD